jgi:hypothetical protein
MPRRNRFVALLMLPSAVCLWSVGWVLFWVGRPREPAVQKKAVKVADSAGLSFVVAVPEKEIVA